MAVVQKSKGLNGVLFRDIKVHGNFTSLFKSVTKPIPFFLTETILRTTKSRWYVSK